MSDKNTHLIEEKIIDLNDIILSYNNDMLHEVLIPNVILINVTDEFIKINESISKSDAYIILKHLWQNTEQLACYEFPLTYETSKEQRVSKVDIKVLHYLKWNIN